MATKSTAASSGRRWEMMANTALHASMLMSIDEASRRSSAESRDTVVGRVDDGERAGSERR